MKTLNQEIFQPLQVYDDVSEMPHKSTRYARQIWKSGVNCYVKYTDDTVPSKRFLFTPFTIKNGFDFTFATITLINIATGEEIDVTNEIASDHDYSTIDGSYYYRILGQTPVEKSGIKSGYYYLKFVGTNLTKYSGEFYINALKGESSVVEEFEDTGQLFNSRVKQLHSSTVTGLLHTGDQTGLYSYDGTSWTKELTVTANVKNNDSIYFADYDGTLYASIADKIYSNDGAGNWSEVYQNSNVIIFTQAVTWNSKMYFAGTNGILIEYDGSTWTELDVPGATLAAFIMFDENQETNNLFLVFRDTIYEYDGTDFTVVTNHPGSDEEGETYVGHGNRSVYNSGLSSPGWIIPGYQIIFTLHFFEAQNDWVKVVLKNFSSENYIVKSMNKLSDNSIYFGIRATGGIAKFYKLVGDVVTYLKDSPGVVEDMVPHGGDDYIAIGYKVYKWNQT
jgi:hypothetical protein